MGQLKGELAATANKRGLASYVAKVADKICGNIVLPPGIQGNPEAIFIVNQLPSGDVIDVKIRKSSGNKALDDAIERAIRNLVLFRNQITPSFLTAKLKIPYKPYNE